jgi:outer membrane protein
MGLGHCRLERIAVAAVGGAALLPIVASSAAAQPVQGAQPNPATPTVDTGAQSRILSLAEAERVASEQQPQMLVARAQTDSARAQAEQSGAPLLPQVMATAQYQRTTGNFALRPGAFPGGANGTVSVPGWSLNPQYDLWNFGLSATQLLYDFGQTADKYRASLASVEASRLTEGSTRVQIVSSVRRAYFAARAMKDLVKVARETLEDQEKHLGQVQGFVTVGTQPQIALAQQKAALATARVQLITTQNNYETSKAQLNQAAGITTGTDYDVADDDLGPVDGEDQPLDVLVAKAIAARPELAALERQRAAARDSLSSARGGYGPSLAATANATESGIALDGLVPNWNVGLLLTWPLFQGGLTKGAVHVAEASVETAEAQRALEELQIRLDVDSARLAVRAAKATIGAADDALTNAREQLRLAEQRYATAVGSIIELYDAQVAFSSAAAQVVQARYGLAAARAQLLAALGRA